MPPANTLTPPHTNEGPLPLDSTLYNLDEGQQRFFKQITGITDSEDLKQHVIRVQAQAYDVGKLTARTSPRRAERSLLIGFPVSLHTSLHLCKVW